MAYADVEVMLRDWLDTNTASGVTVIVQPDDGLPTDLTYLLPLIAVQRIGGLDDTLSLDTATVDVDVFAATHGTAKTLAEQVRSLMRLTLPGTTSGGLTVARVRTGTAPTGRDWQAQSIHLVSATYELVAHATALSA